MTETISVASIRTRFYGPTKYRTSRIRASDGGVFGEKPRLLWFSSGCHAGTHQELHRYAAQAWLDEHNSGATVKGLGYNFGYNFGSDYFWTWTHTSR